MSQPLFDWPDRRTRILVFSRGCLGAVHEAIDRLADECGCSAAALQECYAARCPLRRILVELRI